MENYNENLLNEVNKLKETANSFQGLSAIFEKLSTIAEKHIEINKSFEENIHNLNEYNEEFSSLNSAIRTNVIELKETALKFPEQLNDITDKNAENIDRCELLLSQKMQENKYLIIENARNNKEDLSNTLNKIIIFLIFLVLIDILMIGLFVYKFILVQ
ncbi:MAG: hypothetical protein VZR09_08975 [Candidatus Gastranaerophilaceae bacterium]|nr:hypothetical protein [Candidatus Gastranaerophilaceae bacterium]